MSVFEVVSKAKVDNLHCTVICNGCKKYLCFTKLGSKSWSLQVTDGIDLWLLDLDEAGLENHKDLHESPSVEVFLSKFRNEFNSGIISIGHIGSNVTLSVGSGAANFNFNLAEAKSAEKKIELQSILFKLADSVSQLEKELSAVNEQMKSLRAEKSSSSGISALMDLSPKKAGGNKTKPNKAGMSVINPSSRKRKAAAGVVFEES
ncbi:protein PAXX-like [Physella acuta]|uniref:protein PAXX-like n=1 Tax=Physella acuta TaxID=109671 RepID=UPI0027DB45CD|nr:protein PAXX-like [Physella acuta]